MKGSYGISLFPIELLALFVSFLALETGHPAPHKAGARANLP